MKDTGRPFGYYVHHQGCGHLARARLLQSQLGRRVHLIGTGLRAQGVDGLDLPDDRITPPLDEPAETVDRPRALHYAPLRHTPIRRRMAMIARWIETDDPGLMIVDVSVEVAMLARLCSVPVVYVRLYGKRDDPAHLEAFRGATAVVSPFPRQLEPAAPPAWLSRKLFHAGFLDDLDRGALPRARRAGRKRIGMLVGAGGCRIAATDILSAAAATPGHDWDIVGLAAQAGDGAPNVIWHGWIDDPTSVLSRADLIVATAGDGATATAIALGRPTLLLPQSRPYGEQTIKAAWLADRGAVLCRRSWPNAAAWPALVDDLSKLDPSLLAGLRDRGALGRTAAFLERLATEAPGR